MEGPIFFFLSPILTIMKIFIILNKNLIISSFCLRACLICFVNQQGIQQTQSAL